MHTKLLLLALGALSALVVLARFGYGAPSAPDNGASRLSYQPHPPHARPGLPPVDLDVPARFETATFAMG